MSIANDRLYAMPTHRLRFLVKKNMVTAEEVRNFAFDNKIGFQEAHKFWRIIKDLFSSSGLLCLTVLVSGSMLKQS